LSASISTLPACRPRCSSCSSRTRKQTQEFQADLDKEAAARKAADKKIVEKQREIKQTGVQRETLRVNPRRNRR